MKMENLDPASVETQQIVVAEIFKLALTSNGDDVTLSSLLQSYDRTIGKHGISASDVEGIQIYRALLHWSRQPKHSRQTYRLRSDAVFDFALQPLHATPEKTSKPRKSPNLENVDRCLLDCHMHDVQNIGSLQEVRKESEQHNLKFVQQMDEMSQLTRLMNNINEPNNASQGRSALPSSRQSRSSSPTPYFPDWTPLAFPARAPSPRYAHSRQSSSRSRSMQGISHSRSVSPLIASDLASRRGEMESFQRVVLTSWRVVSRQRLKAQINFCQVRGKRAQNRIRQWLHAYQRSMTRSRELWRVILSEWRAVVSHCRELRSLLKGIIQNKKVQMRADCLRWWLLMHREAQAERELMTRASKHGRRAQLTRALVVWQTRSHQVSFDRQMCTAAVSLIRDRARRVALTRWHVAIAPKTKLMHTADSFRVLVDAFQRSMTRSRGLLRVLLLDWRAVVSHCRGLRDLLMGSIHEKKVQRRVECLCWWMLMCRKSQAGRELMTQASKHGRRAKLTRALVVWQARSHQVSVDRQIYTTAVSLIRDYARRVALARWHAAGVPKTRLMHAARSLHVLRRQRLQRRGLSLWLHRCISPIPARYIREFNGNLMQRKLHFALCCWRAEVYQTVNRRQDVEQRCLTAFSRALINRLFHHWDRVMRFWRNFHCAKRASMKRAIVRAWCSFTSKRKNCTIRESSLVEKVRRNKRSLVFLEWHGKVCMRASLRSRTQNFVMTVCIRIRRAIVMAWCALCARQRHLRSRTQDFVITACVRIRRRAVMAWCAACARQRRVLSVGEELLAKTASRLEVIAFQAMLCYCQQSQQSNIFVRLSALYLRKCSLMRGIRRLETHRQDQVALRTKCRTIRRSMQVASLQQWRSLRLIRKDISRRTAAARNWAQSKLKLFAWFAWFQWLRAMQSERHRIMIFCRARSSRIASRGLHEWHQHVLQRSNIRKLEIIARRARRCRRVSMALKSWQTNAHRKGRLAVRTSLLASQTLKDAMVIWKRCVQEGRAFDVHCICVLIVQRFKLVFAAWRREVLLSNLVKDVSRSREQLRLEQVVAAWRREVLLSRLVVDASRSQKRVRLKGVLHAFRERTRRTRLVKKAQNVARGRRQTNIARLCISGWIDHIRQKGCWRVCVEVMLAAIHNHLLINCLSAWLRCVKFLHDVRRKGVAVSVDHRAALVTRCLASLHKQTAVSQHLRKCSAASVYQVFRICWLTWCEFWKSRARCHQCAAQLQQRLRYQHRQLILQYWTVRHRRDAHVRKVLLKFYRNASRKRLQSFFLAWCSEHRHAQSVQLRVASNIIRMESEVKQRTLRCLALWFVHCVEWREGFAAFLHTRQQRFLTRVFSSFFYSCRRRACCADSLAAFLRDRNLTSVREMWAVWRCRIAERWVFGERKQQAAQCKRRAVLRRGLSSWLTFSHARHLVREEMIAAVQHKRRTFLRRGMSSWLNFSSLHRLLREVTKRHGAQIQQLTKEAFIVWISVVRKLVELEKRRRREVENKCLQRHCLLCASVISAWHQESAVARFERRAIVRRGLLLWAGNSHSHRLLREALSTAAERHSVQVQLMTKKTFSAWASAARVLIELERRRRLQVDNIWRKRRFLLCTFVAYAWHQEITVAHFERRSVLRRGLLLWLRFSYSNRLVREAILAATKRHSMLVQRVTKETFSFWVSVARLLVELERKAQLQVDTMWRRRRCYLCTSVISAWHQETARAIHDADRTLASKVLICWGLYAQEQILLRGYLSECSLAGFRGVRGGASSSGYGVREADFQNLYEQMAEHRWDLVSVMSD